MRHIRSARFFFCSQNAPLDCPEVYSYVRPPYKDPFVYGTVVPIAIPPDSLKLIKRISMILRLIYPNPQT